MGKQIIVARTCERRDANNKKTTLWARILESSMLLRPDSAHDYSLVVKMSVLGPGYGTPHQRPPESRNPSSSAQAAHPN